MIKINLLTFCQIKKAVKKNTGIELTSRELNGILWKNNISGSSFYFKKGECHPSSLYEPKFLSLIFDKCKLYRRIKIFKAAILVKSTKNIQKKVDNERKTE
jgi:hypothetical protein